jgi:hypothetical protein
MIGAVSKLNDTIFDFLIDDQSSNDSWQRDQAILHQFIGLLNQTINTSKIETDGLYISTSGHKFYKFNTTYLIPIRAQELTFPIPMIASVLDPEDYPLSVENF